jgi:hypothetical protein
MVGCAGAVMKKRKKVKADIKTYDAMVVKAVKQHETKDERYANEPISNSNSATDLTPAADSLGRHVVQEGTKAPRKANCQAHQS